MGFHPPFNSSVFNAMEKASRNSPGSGLNLPTLCDVCGKPRAHHSHTRCSKIRQHMMKMRLARSTQP